MSLTEQQLAGKKISTGFGSIPDETWKSLAKDKKRRQRKESIKKTFKWLKSKIFKWLKK